MFNIKQFNSEARTEWNYYVSRAKNSSFLFYREYMDYHSDRFEDYSLMFYIENKLYAILPANRINNELHSHQGLTYGGLIVDEHVTVARTLTLFEELNEFLKSQGFTKVIYKPIPYIYNKVPAEEDLYAIFKTTQFQLVGRDVGTVINLRTPYPWYRIRERGVKRALQNNIYVEESQQFNSFWGILTQNLQQKYGVQPVHSLSEIELLHSRFPNNIALYVAKQQNEVLAGIVLYLINEVAHVQYISASKEGKAIGALDLLFHEVIHHKLKDYTYFDFGRSTENNGLILNEPLMYQKEGFGGRAMCWDKYEWTL